MTPLDIGQEEIKFLSKTLRKVDFFSDLTVADLDQILDFVQFYAYPAGKTIFKKGDRGDSFYMIREGEVQVLQPRFLLPDKPILSLSQAQFFGEVSLVQDEPRTATIKTMTPCKLFVLLASDFKSVQKKNPFFSTAISRIASRRKFHTDRLAS